MANLKQSLLLICVLFASSGLSGLLATELPQFAPPKHMGVATCANSSCHAVVQLEEPSNVLQNEYLTWLFHDRHANAYSTLLTDQSKAIARKLGLQDASKAAICLDCHADNVPVEKRGPEFHLSDGVGCEACHGGSEIWLSRHTLKPYSAKRNLHDGMYPLASLVDRTKLCASCHVGDARKLANHNIMGAGHPRLGFELDTFTIRQPEHYVVDEDYLQRKNLDSPIRRLLFGTAVQAQLVAQNLSGALVDNPIGHPEIALYDCHSCHHSLKDLQWQKRPSTTGLKTGSIRLNDSSFLLLSALSGALDPALKTDLLKAINALHSASSRSVTELQNSAVVLLQLGVKAQLLFQQTQLNDQHKREMIDSIVRLGIAGEYHDYISAEQAVMALDVLSFSLPPEETLSELINSAYKLIQNDESYQADVLRSKLAEYLE